MRNTHRSRWNIRPGRMLRAGHAGSVHARDCRRLYPRSDGAHLQIPGAGSNRSEVGPCSAAPCCAGAGVPVNRGWPSARQEHARRQQWPPQHHQSRHDLAVPGAGGQYIECFKSVDSRQRISDSSLCDAETEVGAGTYSFSPEVQVFPCDHRPHKPGEPLHELILPSILWTIIEQQGGCL